MLACVLAHATAFGADRDTPHTEVTPVPIAGGNSDVGFGGGVLISVGRVDPDFAPYLYRLEASGLMTLRSQSGKVVAPFQDAYILSHFPNLVKNKLGLTLRVSYTRETTFKYYGLGNASQIPAGRGLNDPFFEYDRIHPTVRVSSQQKPFEPISLELAVSYTQNWLTVPADSKLALDRQSTDRLIRDRTANSLNHGVLTYSYAFGIDTRDNEVTARHGVYYTARIDWSPGGYRTLPYRWGRFDSSFRVFLPLPARATLALRMVSDLLFGEPPIYELALFDPTPAIGGPNGIRGVPGERYYGMLKLFGNAEIRAPLFDFRFLSKTNTFGLAAFCDTGRLWASYERRPDLDGTGIGLKYGLGVGPRISAGKTFVLRLDVAWSPDASPVGVYLASGHIF